MTACPKLSKSNMVIKQKTTEPKWNVRTSIFYTGIKPEPRDGSAVPIPGNPGHLQPILEDLKCLLNSTVI